LMQYHRQVKKAFAKNLTVFCSQFSSLCFVFWADTIVLWPTGRGLKECIVFWRRYLILRL
jgi:hypothetical protein